VERITIFGVGASVFTLLVVSGVFFVALLAYLTLAALGKRPRSAEMAARGDTVFLPLFVREYWDWAISPASRALMASRLHPDVITWFSLLVSLGAGLAFAVGYFGLGGWLYIFAGTCDMFDGKVARARGLTSRAGAFLDSTLDRYTEIAVLGGLAYHFAPSFPTWLAVAAMGGSLMVSYTRARGEGLGYSCREGGMQRAERIVYLGLAGVFGKVAEAMWPATAWSERFMIFALALLAVSTNFTAFQRLVVIRRELRRQESDEKAGIVLPHPTLRRVPPRT
jgi:phosphatidylglycerophosphate synthase